MVVIIWYDCGMIVIITVTLYYSEILIYFYTHLISLSLSLLLHLQGVQQKYKSSTKPEQVAQLISPQALQQVDSFVWAIYLLSLSQLWWW